MGDVSSALQEQPATDWGISKDELVTHNEVRVKINAERSPRHNTSWVRNISFRPQLPPQEKDTTWLQGIGGAAQLATLLRTDPAHGISTTDLEHREAVFGANRYQEIPPKGFLYLWWQVCVCVCIFGSGVCI